SPFSSSLLPPRGASSTGCCLGGTPLSMRSRSLPFSSVVLALLPARVADRSSVSRANNSQCHGRLDQLAILTPALLVGRWHLNFSRRLRRHVQRSQPASAAYPKAGRAPSPSIPTGAVASVASSRAGAGWRQRAASSTSSAAGAGHRSRGHAR